MSKRRRRERVLILWNFVGEDVYERLQDEGPQPLPWDPEEESVVVSTAAEEIGALTRGLRRAGYHTRAVNIADDFDRLVDEIRSFRPHVVFNLVEHFNDDPLQEAWVAGVFGLLGVAYTGSMPLCLGSCQRKFRTKLLLDAEGIPTPPYRLVEKLPVPRRLGLEFPLIVKPAREDASGGIGPDAVVSDRRALEARVASVLEEFEQPALIERYIEGREIHAAILGNDPPRVLPLMEIVFDEPARAGAPKILSYDAKWDPSSREFYSIDAVVPPRRLPSGAARRVRDVALRAYRVLGCRDYARVDLRLDRDGNPYVLEVNPNPDLVDDTGFMLCAAKSGRSFDKTLAEIVAMARRRGV